MELSAATNEAGLTGPLEVRSIVPPQTLFDGRTTAEIWVGDVFFTPEGQPAEQVSSYCFTSNCPDPHLKAPYMVIIDPDGLVITLDGDDQDFVNYKRNYGTGRLIGYYQEFTKQGTYQIEVVVTYGDFTVTKVTSVTQVLDIDPAGPDAYEDDDEFETANSITVNDPAPQRHNFHTSEDVDHFTFFVKQQSDTRGGDGYTIRICPINLRSESEMTSPTFEQASSQYLDIPNRSRCESDPLGVPSTVDFVTDSERYVEVFREDGTPFDRSVSYNRSISQGYALDRIEFGNFLGDLRGEFVTIKISNKAGTFGRDTAYEVWVTEGMADFAGPDISISQDFSGLEFINGAGINLPLTMRNNGGQGTTQNQTVRRVRTYTQLPRGMALRAGGTLPSNCVYAATRRIFECDFDEVSPHLPDEAEQWVLPLTTDGEGRRRIKTVLTSYESSLGGVFPDDNFPNNNAQSRLRINPFVDSDGDGLPDDYEDVIGLDKTDPNDANVDLDGDQVGTLEEFLAGTDPGSNFVSCPPGFFLNSNSICEAAPAGSFVSESGATAAALCAIGSYQDETGQSQCKLSPINFFVDQAGATSPTICPDGTVQRLSGQSACEILPLEVRSIVPPQTLSDGRTTAEIWVGDIFFTPVGEPAEQILTYCTFNCVEPYLMAPHMVITDPDGLVITLDGDNQDFVNYKRFYDTGRLLGYYREFTKQGTYQIEVTIPYGPYTVTKTTTVTQALDIDPAGPDAYEDDEDLDSANSITVNDPAPQRHNFHTSGDVDHIIFFARNVNDTKFGLGYTIQICPVNLQAGSALTAPTYLSTSSDYPLSSEFTNPTDCESDPNGVLSTVDFGSETEVYIEVFKEDGTLIDKAVSYTAEGGYQIREVDGVTIDGQFLTVKISNKAGTFGRDTAYAVRVTEDMADFAGPDVSIVQDFVTFDFINSSGINLPLEMRNNGGQGTIQDQTVTSVKTYTQLPSGTAVRAGAVLPSNCVYLASRRVVECSFGDVAPHVPNEAEVWVLPLTSDREGRRRIKTFVASLESSVGGPYPDDNFSNNVAQARIRINPLVDGDGDGLPDDYEDAIGLDKTDPNDASEDLDGDMVSTLDEFLAGTDPGTKSVNCTPGFFLISNSVCEPAPAGSFVSGSGATAAELCAIGSYQDETGQVQCKPAPINAFVDQAGATAATACPAGTDQALTGQSTCNTIVPVCTPGNFLNSNSVCEAAPAGSFVSGSGATAAELCAIGSYQDESGQVQCKPAPINFFVDQAGATAPTACPAGTDQALLGQSLCDVFAFEVRSITPPQTLFDGRTTAEIWVEEIYFTPEGQPSEQVSSNCFDNNSCPDPHLKAPYMVITDPDGLVITLDNPDENFVNYKSNYGTGRMIGYYQEFTKQGTYQIEVIVTYGIYTVSKTTTVTQVLDIDPSGPDAYEDDEELETANAITVNDAAPQRRNFHTSEDVDHITFFAKRQQDTAQGRGYKVQICPINLRAESELTSPTFEYLGSNFVDVNNRGRCEFDPGGVLSTVDFESDAEVYIEVFREDGTPVAKTVTYSAERGYQIDRITIGNFEGGNLNGEFLTVKISNKAGTFGRDTAYEVRVTEGMADFAGPDISISQDFSALDFVNGAGINLPLTMRNNGGQGTTQSQRVTNVRTYTQLPRGMALRTGGALPSNCVYDASRRIVECSFGEVSPHLPNEAEQWVLPLTSDREGRRRIKTFLTSYESSLGGVFPDDNFSNNVAQARLRINPFVDGDGDGLPDDYEDAIGLDKTDPNDASEDLDGDMVSTLDEFLAGTDPGTKSVNCTPGFFLISNSVCEPAPAGSFVSGSGATAAELCAIGSYQDETGQVQCKPAPVNAFVDQAGATSPTACPAGTDQALPGQSACNNVLVQCDGPRSGAIRLQSNQVIELPVRGICLTAPDGTELIVPDTATAASLNVTAVSPGSAGFLTVWPCGSVDRPLSSNLNYATGGVVPNGVIASIGNNGSVCVFAFGDTDLVVDVAGWFEGNAFDAATPQRLIDTRDGTGGRSGKVTDSIPLQVQVSEIAVSTADGTPAVIPAGVSAVALNVTVANPDARGFLTVYPCDVPRPLASNLNFVPGLVVANGVVAPTSTNGEVCVYASAPTDIIVDLAGWFPGDAFTASTPIRKVDSRDGTGSPLAKLNPASFLSVPMHGTVLTVNGNDGQVPLDATAVALNVTIVNPVAAGFATVWPCSAERPVASNLNFVAGQIVANNVTAPIGDQGNVCFYSNVATDIVVDLSGYYSGSMQNEFKGATPRRYIDTRSNLGPAPQ